MLRYQSTALCIVTASGTPSIHVYYGEDLQRRCAAAERFAILVEAGTNRIAGIRSLVTGSGRAGCWPR